METVSTREKLLEARWGMLAPAEELHHINSGCGLAGFSRSHRSKIVGVFEEFGSERSAPQARRRPAISDEIPPERVGRDLETTEGSPSRSDPFVVRRLRLAGFGVSLSVVWAVRMRRGPTLRARWWRRLERETQAKGGVLSESPLQVLRHRGRTADPQTHGEAPHPGLRLLQNGCFAGDDRGRSGRPACGPSSTPATRTPSPIGTRRRCR